MPKNKTSAPVARPPRLRYRVVPRGGDGSVDAMYRLSELHGALALANEILEELAQAGYECALTEEKRGGRT